MSPKLGQRRHARRLERLALIGAGGVGAAIAHLAVTRGMAREIVLTRHRTGTGRIRGTRSHPRDRHNPRARQPFRQRQSSDVAGAQVVVVTAGRPRTPGMSRADLLQLNRRVIQSIAEVIRTAAPDAVVILVTNQLDEMTMEMLRATGFPRERVPGMAGTLDSSRFRYALAARAGVPVADVEAMTLGSHGDEMAPIISRARIRGRAINDFLSADAIRDAVDDAVTGGGQVVALRKTGSAALAPAHATVELLDHMRGDRAGVVPASVLLQGEYGLHDVVLGVPCRLAMGGLTEVVELPLAEDETAQLIAAASAIQQRLAD